VLIKRVATGTCLIASYPTAIFCVSIVPLSTTVPNPILGHHTQIQFDPVLPDPYSALVMWFKGDIVLTVAFHRLRLLFSGWNQGQRVYDVRVLDAETLEKVRNCVRAGLGL